MNPVTLQRDRPIDQDQVDLFLHLLQDPDPDHVLDQEDIQSELLLLLPEALNIKVKVVDHHHHHQGQHLLLLLIKK